MCNRDSRTAVTAALALALAWLCVSAPAARAETRESGKRGDEAIRKAIQSYVAAYNKKDVAALMAHWADDAEFVDEAGKAVAGRAALTAMFKKTFADGKDTTLKVASRAIRFLKPDVALLDGTATTVTGDGATDSSPFTAVLTRVDGKWLLARVQDLPDEEGPDASSHSKYLKPLEWLVGDWESVDKDNRVSLTCKWTRKQNFLLIEQSIHVKDREVMSVTQVIGWDPREEQVRSWVFDASGGFGEGWWTRDGNRWVVKSDGVAADGAAASATNTWKFLDDKTFEWESTERQIEDAPMPDIRLRYVRKNGTK